MSSTSSDPVSAVAPVRTPDPRLLGAPPLGLGFPPWLVGAVGVVFVAGLGAWIVQALQGLGVTGLGRDVTWGLYISQFTFLVGVAASAVMVVIPYYLHEFKAFGRLLVLGEILAVSAVVAAGLFVFVDLGQPARVFYVMLHPSPRSPMFWDMVSLGGYLVLNAALVGVALWSERYGLTRPTWVRPLVWLSIPWAVSIHTVTAFLYAGLPGRPLWETAVLAPRFLASAFASGPGLLLLLALALRRVPSLDPGAAARQGLRRIVAWGLAANAFLLAVELFTALYSHRGEHVEALRALYLDLSGPLPIFAWGAQAACVTAFAVLLSGRSGTSDRWLGVGAALAFGGVWLEKGMAMVVSGFGPAPFGDLPVYVPTVLEGLISAGVWAVGIAVWLVGVRIVRVVRG